MSTLAGVDKSAHPTGPGMPVGTAVPDVFKDLWIIYYTVGGNPHPVFKFFRHSGTLQETVERCKDYCRIMGYRQLFVTPLFIDMDTDEYRRMNPGH
jgi:hypothetical protein